MTNDYILSLSVRGHLLLSEGGLDCLQAKVLGAPSCGFWAGGLTVICRLHAPWIMARKAKYDWGKSRDGRYQKFETRLAFEIDSSADAMDTVYIDTAQCFHW